ALKLIDKETLDLKNYNPKLYYLLEEKLQLEGNGRGSILRVPVRFQRVVWIHYYYKYFFTNLFNLNTIESDSIKHTEPLDLSAVLEVSSYSWDALVYFSMERNVDVKDKWYEIEYSDKNERYTKRIIKVIELTEELQEDKTTKRILQANCLLRNGKIRHFRVSRIKSYRELNGDFVKSFVG